ncbi:MAG: hypothetical protein EOP45_23175 [Sphingobacteriaceae bacterium]|nr:MAG: hypothetical protein EOP45_23175 [Sphingobacteriaceae bacterium]
MFFDGVKSVDSQDDGTLVNMGRNDHEGLQEETAVRQVTPESLGDVELPNSTEIDEDDLFDKDEPPTNYNTDAVRRDFEEELQLDRYNYSEEQEKEALEKENQEKKRLADEASKKIPKENIVSIKKKITPAVINDDYANFDNFLVQASVKVSNDKSHKAYKAKLSA